MSPFKDPNFANSILGIAQSYGDLAFWTQNLDLEANPDATWRALLVVGCLKGIGYAEKARDLLQSPDSRVRAWACFALGEKGDKGPLDRIHSMLSDPSCRVRVLARHAIQVISGVPTVHMCGVERQEDCLVLVSDDSQQWRDLLAFMYEDDGYKVAVAASEQETVELALKLTPQAIITDNQKGFDNLSGLNMTWDLCRRPELRDTAFVMYTADFVEPIFIWSGGDRHFVKGRTEMHELRRAVREYSDG